jgi:uncharacterized protein YbjT (DUF2867 family)
MEKVLVAGATGTTGRQVIHLLKQSQAYEPIAMVRKKEQQQEFKEKGVETVLADLTEDLDGVTSGSDRVIFAAGSKGKNLEAVDRDGAIKMADDAAKNKVKKFVMLSSIGTDEPENGGDMQDYLRAKKKADEHLRSTNLKYTIVRPGALNNDEATHAITLREKIQDRNSIPRADVAQVLVDCLQDDIAQQATFEMVSGPTPIHQALANV